MKFATNHIITYLTYTNMPKVRWAMSNGVCSEFRLVKFVQQKLPYYKVVYFELFFHNNFNPFGCDLYKSVVSVSTSRSREANISVLAIFVSCPRPIFDQIVKTKIIYIKSLSDCL